MSRPIDSDAGDGAPILDDGRRSRTVQAADARSARPAEGVPVAAGASPAEVTDVTQHAAADPGPREEVRELGHREITLRQRERFGGVKVGSAFFGWLAATGLAVLSVVALTALGVGLGVVTDQNVDATMQEVQAGTDRARTIGLVGAIVMLVILFVAYLAGGYVAGRMARFNGALQGVAVWLWGVVITAVTAGIAAIGAQQNILERLDLPSLRIGEQPSAAATAVGIAIAAAVALIGAVLGGLIGMRFHRRVDRVALAETRPTEHQIR